MTAKSFYRQLLNDINVSDEEIQDARARRDELRATLQAAIGEHSSGVTTFPSGALAAGTQISPINDVDVVVTVPNWLVRWQADPACAMDDVLAWIEPFIDAAFDCSTHAIKLTYPNESFTADVVIGVETKDGILIPHCPEGEPRVWL